MKIIIKSFLTFLLLLVFQEFSFAGEVVSWEFKTGGIVYATPLIVNNTVYIGSEDSIFYAINFDDGSEIWQYKAGNKILSTAAYSNEVICFESGNVLYGLNTDGTEKWRVTISEGTVTNHYDAWDYFHSSPNVVDGVAYVGSERGQVIGVNIQTGEEVFRIDTGDRGVGIHVKPEVWENKIYFGECSGKFYCYNINTKEKVWEYDTNPEKLWQDPAILTNPVVNNGIVYFGGRHCHLYGLNAENGTKVWWYSDPDNMWILGGPTISDSLLFVGSSNQQVLHSLGLSTQELLWKKKFDGRILGTPFVKEDKVFFGTGKETSYKVGSLYAVNKNTGEVLNRFAVNSQVHSSPIIINNKIVFGSANKYVYALDEEEMLNCEHPESRFSEEGEIDLGELKQDTTISIGITNPYNVADSVSFSWAYSPIGENLFIEPENLILAPSSQHDVYCTIRASVIAAGNYTVTLKMSRHLTLSPYDKDVTKSILFKVTTVTSVNASETLLEYTLSQNYPNPFNSPSTKIKYSIVNASQVKLSVFDTLGKKVATIVNEYKNPGSYEVSFNASGLSSGIYYYRLTAGNYDSVKKLAVLK
ncbi:MAG: PQQ-binding-like beta-propeller repeat protein [Ignavibacteria bacterium]